MAGGGKIRLCSGWLTFGLRLIQAIKTKTWLIKIVVVVLAALVLLPCYREILTGQSFDLSSKFG